MTEVVHAVRRAGALALATATLLLAAAAVASAAPTPTLGANPGKRSLTVATSSCPAGTSVSSVLVGARGDVVDAVAPTCSDGSLAPVLGTGSLAPEHGATTSSCPDGSPADGLHGRAGFALDAVGLLCDGSPAPLAGRTGGNPSGPLACPAGESLVGLQAGLGDYFGTPSLFTLTGLCAPLRATDKQQCKDGGWRSFGDTYRNQGDCTSDVERRRRP